MRRLYSAFSRKSLETGSGSNRVTPRHAHPVFQLRASCISITRIRLSNNVFSPSWLEASNSCAISTFSLAIQAKWAKVQPRQSGCRSKKRPQSRGCSSYVPRRRHRRRFLLKEQRSFKLLRLASLGPRVTSMCPSISIFPFSGHGACLLTF